jgi:predicted outer membrane repeat protein
MKRLAVTLLFFVLAMASSAGGKTWIVNFDGSGDAPTIQAGIDSAAVGDTILLNAGQFSGPGNKDVSFLGKAVTVTSASGPMSTIIDCQGSGRAFVFVSGEDASSVVSELKITNGFHSSFGGAIYCLSSSPTISGNILEQNRSGSRGGAVYCDTSSAAVVDNLFMQNSSLFGGSIWCSGSSDLTIDGNEFSGDSASADGGAIACRNSDPMITSNLFIGNTASFGAGVHCRDVSSAVIQDNVFRNNTAASNGGGIYCANSSPAIGRNVFRNNQASLGGGIHCEDNVSADIFENTFSENSAMTASGGAGIHCSNSSFPQISRSIIVNSTSGKAIESAIFSVPTISCCDLFGNAGGNALPVNSTDGGGNFSQGPEFCGGTDNFYLQPDSPCAPGNHPNLLNCGLIGALPINCDDDVSSHIKTWGEIKSLYRD